MASHATFEQDRRFSGGKVTDWGINIFLAVGVLAARQEGVGHVPLEVLRLCRRLQVLGEGGEALAATKQSGRLAGL